MHLCIQSVFSFLSSQQVQQTHVNKSIHISNVLELHVLQRENIIGKANESFIRGDEWSIKIFNCSQNFTFARFARKI